MYPGSLNRAPAAGIVLPHYLFGAITFLICTILLVFSSEALTGHYFHPRLLSITHLMALGWGTVIVFGALYQLLPVILEVTLFSTLLARISFWLLAPGILLLGWSFWNFIIGWPLQLAGTIITLAITLFLVNLIITVKKVKQWNIETDFIVTATFWLWFTAVAGLTLVFNLTLLFLPQDHLHYLKIHAHFGMVGWFVLLIIGVGSRLIPTFLLSHNLDRKKLDYAYYFINGGLIAFSADFLFLQGSKFLFLSALAVIAGLILFLLYIGEAYLKRIRKKLDIGLLHSMLAMSFLLLPLLLSFIFSFRIDPDAQWTRSFSMVYGFSYFFGFLTSLILGQTYKTLPFIVWMHRGRSVSEGKGRLLPKDLYSEQLARWQYLFYMTAMLLLIAGILLNVNILLTIGSFLLLAAAVIYNINVFKILLFSINKKPIDS